MAGRDNIYGNKEQYIQLRNFWLDTIDDQREVFGKPIFLIPFYSFSMHELKKSEDLEHIRYKKPKDLEYWNDQEVNELEPVRLISTDHKMDLWLSKYCPLDFVQDYLKESYSKDWVGFNYKDEINLHEQPFIAEIGIKGSEDPLYLFKEAGDEYIEVIEEFIFYGTTKVLELYHRALYNIYMCLTYDEQISYVKFDYYGLIIHFENGMYYTVPDNSTDGLENGEKVSLSFISRTCFKPSFKHSYDLSEIEGYDPEQILLSDDDFAFDITRYRDFVFDTDHIKRYISLLPYYITTLIKMD